MPLIEELVTMLSEDLKNKAPFEELETSVEFIMLKYCDSLARNALPEPETAVEL